MADRLPAAFITDREISGPIDSSKLEHVYEETANFNFLIGDTPTTKEVILFKADKSGNITEVGAGLNDTGTNTSIAFNIKVNGSTGLLSSAITVTHATADRAEVDGTLASDGAYASGDLVSVIMTVTSSTGALGPFMRIKRIESGD